MRQALLQYVKPLKTLIADRVTLFRRRQGPSETFKEHYANLRAMAVDCELDTIAKDDLFLKCCYYRLIFIDIYIIPYFYLLHFTP